MKLNPDCVRDILKACESEIIMNDLGEMNTIDENKIKNLYSSHSLSDIKYNIKYLYEFGLIDCHITASDSTAVIRADIYDLTSDGHEFLENIKNDETWNKTKSFAKLLGSASLEIIKQVSISLLTQKINSQFM